MYSKNQDPSSALYQPLEKVENNDVEIAVIVVFTILNYIIVLMTVHSYLDAGLTNANNCNIITKPRKLLHACNVCHKTKEADTHLLEIIVSKRKNLLTIIQKITFITLNH